MSSLDFVHLRLHSEYSIVDGLVRIDELVLAAAKDGQCALALTDQSNFFGLIKFYRAAREKGIKPILGCDVWIANEKQVEQPSRLLLLAKNFEGYLQLCKLLSRAWLENQNKGRAELRFAWLEEIKAGDLIALSGAQQGDIGQALTKGNITQAAACAKRWAHIFPDNFYIEIQRVGEPTHASEEAIHLAVEIAAQLGLPVVATHPVQFLKPEEFTAHEARVCIAEGQILGNAARARRFDQDQYFKTQGEMTNRFADLPGALENTIEIAKRCNLTLILGKPCLPDFATPEGMTIADFLVDESRRGLKNRMMHLYPDEAQRQAQSKRYEERLQFELNTIIKMGFPGYFLIVAEFIRWAKENGVPVGPGRGSGAGSLVAYSLLITDLDPLKYNLLFERFLNPERVSMPDFDIDFCQDGRDRVIAHVKELYGKDAVSQIATFGTMAAKGAVRDVGRVLDLGYNFCDGISRLIPFKPGKQVTLAEALQDEPQLAERFDQEEEVHQLLELAQQVEGITRNVGMHAGGVLIAPGKLTDFCPLYSQGGDAGVVSQYDKDDVEAVGLVKFDFLGLTTLTILDWAVRYIRQLSSENTDFDLSAIPLDDKSVYALMSEAKTVAVFQFEGRGMQGMLKDARPDRFEDIIALVALYRPGPMDLIPDFCRRKHGEAFDYPDPRTEGILAETYGIMIYQEQVMQMAQVIGAYSLGEADLLRRAMGKKKPEEMAKHRDIFREGAAKNGLSQEKADEIFDLMEKFAGYGFNKSHAAAYALLAYYTAYLKARHPAAFMAANLSLAMDDTDKVKVLVEDCLSVCDLKLLLPDINLSDYRFTPVVTKDGQHVRQIRYGLGAIKGSGQNAIEAIIEARQVGGPFVDLFDFCKRVDKRMINTRTIESLIRAGAFDCFGVNRGILMASVSFAQNVAEQVQAHANQVSLFDDTDGKDTLCPPEYLDAINWDDKTRLRQEKEALGFYLSGHLFDIYSEEAARFSRMRLNKIKPEREARWICGVIASFRTQMTQRGKMLIVNLDDGSTTVEITVYSELFDVCKGLFKEDEFLLALCKISEDRFSGGVRVVAEKVLDWVGARSQFGQQISCLLDHSVSANQLSHILSPFRSQTGLPLLLRYQSAVACCTLRLGDAWRLAPDDILKENLLRELGAKQVMVEY